MFGKCDGCRMEFYCSYTWYNKPPNLCPCHKCLVKSMCKNADCDVWIAWGNEFGVVILNNRRRVI